MGCFSSFIKTNGDEQETESEQAVAHTNYSRLYIWSLSIKCGTCLRALASAAMLWALKSLLSSVPSVKSKLLLYPSGPTHDVGSHG